MNYTEPDKQEPVKDMGNPAADHRADKKKCKRKFSFGRLLAILFVLIAVVYLSFSVRVFTNFIRILISDPDAAKQPGNAAEALDEIYVEEDE